MTTISPPKNANYAATVVRLPVILPLAGADNIVGAPLFGFQAIVSKDHAAGDLGVVFPAECQLSEAFCSNNNLYRHVDKNKDSEVSGYLEDNRRVRAIKLRGHRSDCLFLPLECLSYLGVDLTTLKEGCTFDSIGGEEICRKFVVKAPKDPRTRTPQPKVFDRVDPALFPEHLDTDNYFRNSHLIAPDQWVYVTQKLHGTSGRWGHVAVQRKLPWRDRVARRLGVQVNTTDWDVVAGSRKVIKDPHNPDQNHFYDEDVWTDQLALIGTLIPEGFVVYGELVGWAATNTALQAEYTYDQPAGTRSLYVYRVAVVNKRGLTFDLSWPQVRHFCLERGLKHVPDLWEGLHSDFDAGKWLDRRFADEGIPGAVSLSGGKKLVDEGVCIRADNRLIPTILKAKSPIFLGHETKMLDKGVVDLEEVADAA